MGITMGGDDIVDVDGRIAVPARPHPEHAPETSTSAP
jgi:hypothetical protein